VGLKCVSGYKKFQASAKKSGRTAWVTVIRTGGKIMNVKRLGATVISAMPIGVGSATKQLAVEAVYLTRHLKKRLKLTNIAAGTVWQCI
jgi:hypothetical protein